jgi:hypothetical protein
LVQGELACVQGELFVVFDLWFGGSCSLLELCFFLGCVEPLPLPKGSETCLLQVILLFAFVWLSIACWSVFLLLSLLLLIKGEIEDHVWFEDRWMVASLCDE